MRLPRRRADDRDVTPLAVRSLFDGGHPETAGAKVRHEEGEPRDRPCAGRSWR
jgi:hypothetical protein